MIDKELRHWQFLVIFVSGLLIGLLVGGAVTESRIGSEIRTDQLELKKDVAEVMADKPVIEDIVQTLLSLVDQLKIERQELRELKILLSKEGELK